MIITPPYHLSGETGKVLGPGRYPISTLGVHDGVLIQRSMDADVLKFSIRKTAARTLIPDDEETISLYDDAGKRLFTGICKRSFSYPAKIYSYEAANVYKGLSETPLLGDDGRPFIIYPQGDLGALILDLLARAAAVGLPIAAPDDMPRLYNVPKMAFRSTTFSGAIEDAMKWAPDLVTRMDYSTEPPTLRFAARKDTPSRRIDLESDAYRTTAIELTPQPEQRALAVSMAYARRDGDDVLLFLTQTAGDDSAEARRKLSVYLSGAERTDSFVTEALTTAQKAVAMAQAAVDAVGASIDAAAASAQIPLTWAALLARDTTLQAAVAAQADFTMSPGVGSSYTVYTGINWPPASPWTGTNTMPTTALALRTSGGALATGWYPIVTGAFTTGELAIAGATKETRYLRGDLIATRYYTDSNVGMNYLETNAADKSVLQGWTQGYAANSSDANNYFIKYLRYGYDVAVDAINMAPTAVAAAVKAAASSGSSALISRAEFVEAPPDLTANFFERQDWTPYKGTIQHPPSVPDVHMPGDFIDVVGDDAPPEWATMKAPVFETEINLSAGAPRIGIGPSPRQDFSSLIDRLRIPQEDNYEPG